MNSILSIEELKSMNFKYLGKNVYISRKASFYSCNNISIGDNVRIDDFCVLSGNITIGNNIHIAVYSAIFAGEAGVEIKDFANISSRVSIYAISDDFSGASMTNPMIPDRFKNIIQKKVVVEKHVIIGASSVILPDAYLAEGASFGAFSLVNTSVEEWSIYAGIPVKKIKERQKKIIELEKEYRRTLNND